MHTPRGFWRSTRVLLRHKRRLAAALAGAVIAAACFGAGIGMILPASYLVLQEGKSLKTIVQEKLLDSDHALNRELGEWVTPLVPQDPLAGFLLIIVASVLLSIVSLAGQVLHGFSVSRLLQRVSRERQNAVFRRALGTTAQAVWTRGPREIISRLLHDGATINLGYAAILGKGVQKVLMGLISLAMALWLNWRLCLVTLIIVPPLLLIVRWTRLRARRRYVELQDHRAGFQSTLQETFGHFDVLKVSSAERYERRRFTRMTRAMEACRRQGSELGLVSGPMVEVLTVIAFGAVAAVAGWMVLRMQVEAIQLLAVLGLLGIVGRSLQVLVGMQHAINLAGSAIERINEIFELPVEREEDEALPSLPRHAVDVRFESVGFTYPGAAHPTINDFSLHVPFGATVAIVGVNGSGKTTLMSLLCRLMEPTTGRILIDGNDPARFRLRSLRDQIAVVMQQPTVFATTVERSIAYGMSHAGHDRVVQAAQIARAHDFITALPQGYQTRIGQGGHKLSGGERQRICLARALLRDPAILILDEATSQIDGDSERQINEALARMRRGRTTFVVAHRLTTMMSADFIVVLERGRIVDQGTHETLISRCEAYRQLTRSQALVGSREPLGV